MKKIALFTILIAMIGITANGSETRSFTDVQGRTIEATPISATDTQVTIVRADGREFTLALSKLSAPDQEFVKKWRAANPDGAKAPTTEGSNETSASEASGAKTAPSIGSVNFEYKISKQSAGRRKIAKDHTVDRLQYLIELTSKARTPLPDLAVKYEMFIRYYDKHSDPKRGVARTEKGEYKLSGVGPQDRVQFKTMHVDATTNKSRERSGGLITSYQYEEDLEGIIIQFYQGETKVGEHTYGRTQRK